MDFGDTLAEILRKAKKEQKRMVNNQYTDIYKECRDMLCQHSTVAGESCDSLIFFPLALGGVVPAAELPKLMIWQVVLKTVYEIIVLPVTIRVVRFLKHHEGEDVYDKNISYNVFKIFSLN